MKKKTYYGIIISIFSAIYLIAMILSTHFVTQRFIQTHKTNLNMLVNDLHTNFQYLDHDSPLKTDEFYAHLLTKSSVYYSNVKEYQQFSVAMYNPGVGKVAQTEPYIQLRTANMLPDDDPKGLFNYYTFLLTELLTERDLTDLVDSIAAFYEEFPEGGLSAWFDRTEEEMPIYKIQINGHETVAESNSNTNPTPLWTWQNPQYTDTPTSIRSTMQTLSWEEGLFGIPYLMQGKQQYENWRSETFLQDFNSDLPKDTFLTKYAEEQYSDIFRGHIFVVRSTSQPLLGAMNDLKYIYIVCLVMVILCIILTIRCTNKTLRQRALLDETRRDFTNAIAHELKTPLSVIRNFSENLQENEHSQKREYYLEQIINQTENMDDLVKEMIYISKLDSEELVLKKEPLSLKNLVQEQLQKFQLVIVEKELEIVCHIDEDFMLEGDKNYMEKAVWNLLSNAVIYNVNGGVVTITLSKEECVIENTGATIPEEVLPHIFDMFYTTEDSHSSTERHLGLGLYLTRRILHLHHLHLTVSNTPNGVKARITK